jgi:hypothetical protein
MMIQQAENLHIVGVNYSLEQLIPAQLVVGSMKNFQTILIC